MPLLTLAAVPFTAAVEEAARMTLPALAELPFTAAVVVVVEWEVQFRTLAVLLHRVERAEEAGTAAGQMALMGRRLAAAEEEPVTARQEEVVLTEKCACGLSRASYERRTASMDERARRF